MHIQPSQKPWHRRSGLHLIAAFLLALCLITGTVAAAGIISIDTGSLTSTPVGTTIQIPVKITGASDVSSYQLNINTGTTDNAVVQFNPASVADKIYNDTTGTIIWMGRMQGYPSINGDTTLFSLDVTPKTTGPIDLTVTVTEIFEGTAITPVAGYTGAGTTLTAIGPATGSGGGGNSGGSNSDGGSSSSGTSGTVSPTETTSITTTAPSAQTGTATNGTPVPTVTRTVATTTATQTTEQTTTPESTKTPVSLLVILTGLGLAGLLTQRKTL